MGDRIKGLLAIHHRHPQRVVKFSTFLYQDAGCYQVILCAETFSVSCLLDTLPSRYVLREAAAQHSAEHLVEDGDEGDRAIVLR